MTASKFIYYLFLFLSNYIFVRQAATAKTQSKNRYFKIYSRKILLHIINIKTICISFVFISHCIVPFYCILFVFKIAFYCITFVFKTPFYCAVLLLKSRNKEIAATLVLQANLLRIELNFSANNVLYVWFLHNWSVILKMKKNSPILFVFRRFPIVLFCCILFAVNKFSLCWAS